MFTVRRPHGGVYGTVGTVFTVRCTDVMAFIVQWVRCLPCGEDDAYRSVRTVLVVQRVRCLPYGDRTVVLTVRWARCLLGGGVYVSASENQRSNGKRSSTNGRTAEKKARNMYITVGRSTGT